MIWTILLILPYSVIILVASIKLRKAEIGVSQKKAPDDSLPKVSVIVAAKNEEENLPKLISDFQNLSYPDSKLEIFIVDDHSSDSSAHIIKKASNISYLLSVGEGKKKAIATGLNLVKGELILTTDADCRLPLNWVKTYAEIYLAEKPDLIIGQLNPEHQKGLVSRFSEIEFYSLQAVTGGMALAGRPIMCNGANLGFSKAALDDYEAMVKSEVKSGDDMFLLHSIKKEGGKIVWLNNGDAIVKTQVPDRLKDLFRQGSRWAGKSIFYKDFDTIFVALSTLIANLSIIAVLVLSIINRTFWPLTIALFLAKIFPDLILLNKYIASPGKLKRLLLFLPASIIYPFYVAVTLIVSMFRRKSW